ncbi:RagB/SusD family nutrient uptake outer membrane protein [Gabonibacter massiliensis]|uniref:RagB/SusD family nutrient uptake outer membrane protein n=1 Tax=Gabonibacter massiliensis TaxID=1720195 RepID=UPI00073F0763|nr:RagB/SusD family nutrient uptake outer membrane protein [Gabonibacter massiliensis]
MKKDVILLLLVFLTVSCNDWLDIEPKSQIDKDKLFSDETGFQNALNGIYQGASLGVLYGKNMSWGMLSAVSQIYDPESLLEEEGDFAEFTYDNKTTEPVVAAIWEKLYNLIANCNLLLNEVAKASPSIFTLDTVSKNVIAGEALALRAFFHFDVVRLFAPAPVTEKDAPKHLIPYQTEWPSEIKKKLTATEALDEVIKDLLQAKDLLAFNDTSYNATGMSNVDVRIKGLYSVKGGKFMNNRGYRLNYCAVLGMLARVYMYKGDRDNAYKYASEFYNTFVVKKKWFKWNASSDFTDDLKYRQKKHLSDGLFSFYNFDLLNNYVDYNVWWVDQAMQIQGVNEIFANDKDDYRLNYLLDHKEVYGEEVYWSIKYQRISGDANINRDEGRALPNLRMSEIYYILAECLYHQGREPEAVKILKELRDARGCKRKITSFTSEKDFYDVLLNDARREFIGEGQLFFMYKRLNRPILTVGSEIAPSAKVFVFDIPNSQNVF